MERGCVQVVLNLCVRIHGSVTTDGHSNEEYTPSDLQ